jgi:exodeoxyribonuclease-3
MMKIISFNVNGLRARLHQLQAVIAQHDPDVIALQETKVHDDQFPRLEVESLGYSVEFHGQKGHYGVALLAKRPAVKVVRGFASDGAEAQRRFIGGWYLTDAGREVIVLNGYFPQGENRTHPTKFPAKRQFYADLSSYLHEFDAEHALLAVVGDMNVAPAGADIGIGAPNEKRWLQQGKSCFLPEERDWLHSLQAWGLNDSFRCLHPQVADKFSWFDYRSRGFDDEPKRGLRIDLILTSAALQRSCVASGIDYAIRAMEKPSDHCPVWAEFAL